MYIPENPLSTTDSTPTKAPGPNYTQHGDIKFERVNKNQVQAKISVQDPETGKLFMITYNKVVKKELTDAEAENITPDMLIKKILLTVPTP